MPRSPFIVQVVGKSGSGKTLLLERAVRALVRRGISVGAVKHAHHPADLPGKDSYRFARAGASYVVFSGPRSFMTLRGDAWPIARTLPVEVLLVEGYSARRLGDLRIVLGGPTEVGPALRRILDSVPGRPTGSGPATKTGVMRPVPRRGRARRARSRHDR